jgi:cytochrome P450
MIAPPLDPVAAATHADPYPYYAALCEAPGLTFDAPSGFWIAASAAAVEAAFAHDALRVRPLGEPVPPALQGTAVGAAFGAFARFNDGERHGAARFALQAPIALVSDALADGIEVACRLGERFDVANDRRALDEWIERFSVYALASALLFPSADVPAVFEAVRAFARALAPNATAAEIQAGSDATEKLREIAILFQSYDATRGAIGNALVALARHPEFAGLVRGDRDAATAFVHETLRYDSPVQNTRRYVATDAEVAGTTLRAGDAVLLVLAAANRDARINADSDRFDPARRAPRLYTFGAGSHACPGSVMAVQIVVAGVRNLLDRGVDPGVLSVAAYRPSPNVRIPLFA